jgi:hypothetical protein
MAWLQLVRYENLTAETQTVFGMQTFDALIERFLSQPAIDIDLLLMMRDEACASSFRSELTLTFLLRSFPSLIVATTLCSLSEEQSMNTKHC